MRTIVLSTVIGLIGLAAQPVTAQDNERTYTIDQTVRPKNVLEIVEVRNLNVENFPAALEMVAKNVGDKPSYGICVVAVFRGTRTGMGDGTGYQLTHQTGSPRS